MHVLNLQFAARMYLILPFAAHVMLCASEQNQQYSLNIILSNKYILNMIL